MTKTTRRPDADLKSDVIDELRWLPSVNSTHIGVAVDDGAVTLSGEVDSYPEMRLAGYAVQHVHGVTALAQDLTVRDDESGVNGTDVARDVGEAMQRAVDVPATVAVSVRDRVVTLSGAVTWQFERAAAERAVRYSPGVRAVVNTVTIRPGDVAVDVKAAIGAAIMRDAALEGKHITVASDAAGLVTLGGTVRSWAERRQAEHASWSAPGVTEVTNNLRIAH